METATIKIVDRYGTQGVPAQGTARKAGPLTRVTSSLDLADIDHTISATMGIVINDGATDDSFQTHFEVDQRVTTGATKQTVVEIGIAEADLNAVDVESVSIAIRCKSNGMSLLKQVTFTDVDDNDFYLPLSKGNGIEIPTISTADWDKDVAVDGYVKIGTLTIDSLIDQNVASAQSQAVQVDETAEFELELVSVVTTDSYQS